MSAFELVKKPINEIRELLAEHAAELRETKFADVHLIKFKPETNVGHPDVNRLKGLIFNSKTQQVCSLTYPVPVEVKDFTPAEQDQFVTDISTAPGGYSVQEALDGTLLRLWFNTSTNNWILSTNGKEDARDAYWMNGCSFDEQFWSAKPNIQMDTLNKNYTYLFILCHPLNVIVVNHTTPQVYHVATYDHATLNEVTDTSGDCGVPRLPNIPLTIEEVQAKTRECVGRPVQSAGYMVIVGERGSPMTPSSTAPVAPPKRYRFENANYTRAREIRGDSNNISFHLLGLLLDSDPTPLEEFLQYYPIYAVDTDALHKRLTALVTKFYREYGARYKQRMELFIHPRHHKFMGEIHTQLYLAQLKGMGKTVQFQDILEFVKKQPVAKVLYLLNYIYD
jgi:hypothetical protein